MLLGALILGIWLVFRIGRARSAFIDALLFTFILMIIHYLPEGALPELGVADFLIWGIVWFSVAMAMWWMDIFCLSRTSAVLYAVVVAVLFYFFQLYLPQWIHGSIT